MPIRIEDDILVSQIGCSLRRLKSQRKQRAANVADTEVEDVPSVSAGENPDDKICSMCADKFKNVFNDEEEE